MQKERRKNGHHKTILGWYNWKKPHKYISDISGEQPLTGRFVLVQMDNSGDELNLKEVKAFENHSKFKNSRTVSSNFICQLYKVFI